MKKRIRISILVAVTVFLVSAAPPQAYDVKLAIPFGVVSGHLVPSGDSLMFIDDQKLEYSFVIPKAAIDDLIVTEETLVITLKHPITDRSGERSRLSFRVASGAADDLQSWLGTVSDGGASVLPTSSAGKSALSGELLSYQAKHDHHFGSCEGRLMISDDRVIYESVSEINHSRQWALKDIKEAERSNPYGIRIEPFTGNGYTFVLMGQGMDSKGYETLVARITAARTER